MFDKCKFILACFLSNIYNRLKVYLFWQWFIHFNTCWNSCKIGWVEMKTTFHCKLMTIKISCWVYVTTSCYNHATDKNIGNMAHISIIESDQILFEAMLTLFIWSLLEGLVYPSGRVMTELQSWEIKSYFFYLFWSTVGMTVTMTTMSLSTFQGPVRK